MIVSYNWLKQYLPFNLKPEDVSEILTNTGLEVESIDCWESVKGSLKNVVIGEIVACEPHPNAEKLKLTKVDVGDGELLQIVCGAPNCRVGLKSPIAKIGSTLYPSSSDLPLVIKKSKIRGEESFGMICAEDELGLGESHEGIMELPTETPVGMEASSYFKVESDYIYSIGLTPNRGDAFSHIGVARDLKAALSAVYNIKLDWTLSDFKINGSFESPISVDIENTNACKRYSYVYLKNINVTQSPTWLKNRLVAIGVKPINSVVDVTNFVLHELGQPLHAFDADKIKGQKIIVKTFENTRKFVALDGIEKEISQNDLMICDEANPLCIAGVYGGLESGVTFDTKNIFLESAFFDPIFIRKTATRLAHRTDAAQRFEKTTDINATINALNRAVELLLSMSNFEYSKVGDVFPNPIPLAQIKTTFDRINKLSGTTIPKDKVTAILYDLGFELQISEDNINVTVPSFKTEVTREADLLEEILRIYGYNTIPFPKSISMAVNQSIGTDSLSFENKIASLLVGAGYQEISTNSISSSKYSSDENELIKLSNAQTSELDSLRSTLIYGQLEVVLSNINHKHPNLRLFEFGNVYKFLGGKYEQKKRICLVNTGLANVSSWIENDKKFDFFSLKSDVESIVAKSLNDFMISDEEDSTFFDYKLTYKYDNETFAEVGQVSSHILKKMGIKQTVYWADINYDFLLERVQYHKIKFKELNKFPAVQRDLSLVLDHSVKYKEIESLVSLQSFKALHSMSLFDIYKGDKIDVSKKAYAIKFTFQDANKTLTDSDIDKYMNRLMMVFEKDLNAQIRKN